MCKFDTVEDEIKSYLYDPKTKVYISYNCELGYNTYAVVVCNSNDCWLNAFDRKEQAREYIKQNKLILVE